MTDKTLLIIGNDKISSRVLAALYADDRLIVAIDHSTSLTRVLRLLRRGSLSIGLLLRMWWCECCRNAPQAARGVESVADNEDVVSLIKLHAPRRVVLFRAGLIISRDVIATGVPIMNIHCAKVPEFGGIGSIARALQAGAHHQCASLHQVTEAIDGGVVLDTEPYVLDPLCSYCANEDRAYTAGNRLLQRTLQQPDVLMDNEIS